MAEYKIGKYVFKSESEYQLAKSELALIKKIEDKYDINNPKVASAVLSKFQPKTIIGRKYSEKLQTISNVNKVSSVNNVRSNNIVPAKSSSVQTSKVNAIKENAQDYIENVYNTTKQKSGGVVDAMFWIRIIFPFIIGIVAFFLFKSLIVTIICAIIFFNGIAANKERCPQCMAWNAFYTAQSECVGNQDVKVRRNLTEQTHRSTGYHSIKTKEIIVDGVEYTYDEIYKCKYCGYEIKGKRTKIVDNLR